MLCDAALAVAPAMTSFTGNAAARLPSKPVATGAALANEFSFCPPPRTRLSRRRFTRRRGRLTLPGLSMGRPTPYCSADIMTAGEDYLTKLGWNARNLIGSSNLNAHV